MVESRILYITVIKQLSNPSQGSLPLILEAGDPKEIVFSIEKEAGTMQSEEPWGLSTKAEEAGLYDGES